MHTHVLGSQLCLGQVALLILARFLYGSEVQLIVN